MLKIRPEYHKVVNCVMMDNVYVLVLCCPNRGIFKSLPDALEYDNILFGKTGWNSDSNVAYYRSDAKLAKEFKV